jgi:Holliday junction resolvase RusA-like endonuclease
MKFAFYVPGIPVPQGSKRIFSNPRTNRPMLVESGGSRWARWRKALSAHALHARGIADPIAGPIKLHVVFALARPLGQLRSVGGHLTREPKPTAPPYPAVKPDFDKLVRAVCDSMKGILIEDDCRVVMATIDKVYDAAEGAYIEVEAVLGGLRFESHALIGKLGGHTWKTTDSGQKF